MAHASECYTSNLDHPLANPIALQALKLASENLREAYANPKNYDAMMNMIWAEYTAAYAFMSGFLGVIHSLSHAVCAYYDIHHGLNNGNPPNEGALEEISFHARVVIWLTPEPKWGWSLGSCDMTLYEPHCKRVEVVTSIEQLGRIAEDLVHSKV